MEQGKMSPYQGVSLHRNLIFLIDEAVEHDPFCTSRAEYIRQAVKHKLQQDQTQKQ
jgi:metal-responsive CopG/Arc/MetJ family transcriptional regulator